MSRVSVIVVYFEACYWSFCGARSSSFRNVIRRFSNLGASGFRVSIIIRRFSLFRSVLLMLISCRIVMFKLGFSGVPIYNGILLNSDFSYGFVVRFFVWFLFLCNRARVGSLIQ